MKPTLEELEKRDLRELAERIAREEGVALERMFGRDRRTTPSLARGRFYAHLDAAGWSEAAIARFVGRDRTSVRWALGRRKAA